ncbi:MAG: SLC13 family permease [Gammaproteobacteria bacterium]|nr:SLC13 family permease [Gammaproteobacteria bacterium]
MLWVLGFLAFTIYLFVSEIVRVDVAAILVMVLLGLTTILPFTPPLVNTAELFDGFASNAVVSIIAVMILGAGLDKTGLMSTLANFILKIGGTTEKRIIPLISGTVGFISSFMQNVGAAALFLPVVSRISARTGLPLSRLLMPMGFCAILGGTATMIGSSPLILLNDLITTSNQSLVARGLEEMPTFDLFAVTPIGLALIITGIAYFMLAGRHILPDVKGAQTTADSTLEYLQEVYGLDYALNEVLVTAESRLVGRTVDEVENEFYVRIIAIQSIDRLYLAPGGLARDVRIAAGQILGILASESALQRLSETTRTTISPNIAVLASVLMPTRAGIAEIVIPPSSNLIGKSCRDVWMRKTYGLTVLAIHRQGKAIREDEGVVDLPLQGGDTLICHIAWEQLARLTKDRNFVVVTTEYPHEELRPHKVHFALLFFAIALGMVLFTDTLLSVALLTGAVGMVVTGVLSMDEAYKAVSWKTVFLLASLIPLGVAVERSGTAEWIAVKTLELVGSDVTPLALQAVIAVLATFFTLVMSNVGATVLLVPLAVNIAVQASAAGVEGVNPAVFALTVALATSNSFLIPTHQVNALIMGPAGYSVKDFMRAGGIMTVLFLVVMLFMLEVVF